MKKLTSTNKAPSAIGPYSQGVEIPQLIFTSGQLGIDPDTNDFVSSDITQQARQVFKNIEAILLEAGSSLDNIVKTTCFIKDMNDFAKVNEVYNEFLNKDNYPARSAIEVSRLPKDALVEIEAIAIKNI